MNRLILLRHAKAEADAPSGDDFDRPLAARGRRDAAEMGRRLAERGYGPDLALVSTALRTRETWEEAAASLADAEVRFEPELYNADAGAIRRLAAQRGAAAQTVLVVAHNPGLQELAMELMARGEAPTAFLAQAGRNFPPAAAAVFTFDAHGRAVADDLLYPVRTA
jgi:phosphohistidine phosphatase